MSIDEVYSKLANHMIKGVMIHEQLATYYDFLGLEGFRKCHEYRYMAESAEFIKMRHYFVTHHNKLIPNEKVELPDIIPLNWYKYERKDVDNTTKRNAVKNGMNIWVDWEKSTKKVLEECYKELFELGCIASAERVVKMIHDVDCELKHAEQYALNKQGIDYDLTEIILEQDYKYKEYKEKLKEVGCKLC